MSVVEPTLLSLARAATVAGATLVILLIAGPSIRPTGRLNFRGGAAFFWLAAAFLLIPGFAIALVDYDKVVAREPAGREELYLWRVWLRLFPVAVMAVFLTPRAITDEAIHCWRQTTNRTWWRECVWEMRLWGRSLWLSAGVVFFLAFAEFEIATTWNMRSWQVALFDAQAGGLPLKESLRLAVPSFVIQALVLAAIFAGTRSDPQPSVVAAGRISSRAGVLVFPLLTGFAFICVFPCSVILAGPALVLVRGGAEVFSIVPWREIWNAFALSAAATTCGWLLAGWIVRRHGPRWLLALPGLPGPMLCGLLLLSAMQVPPLHLLRDTILPVVLGLALVLLPYALLLRLGIDTTRDSAALHLARKSGSRRALWQLDGCRRLCAVLLLFCFGYGDFTINTLLAPPQFTSVSARLLNLLHYGRSDALMVMFVLAFAVPLGAALLTVLFARLYPRRRAS
jgi:hypothetical protein